MSSNYKYNNQDIYKLLDSTGLSNTNYFKNFPTSAGATYGSQIDRPLPFNYQVNGTDLSNTNTAYNLTYNTPTGTTPITVNNPPTATINVPYKHISAFCCGGGGGGGGGGGAGVDAIGNWGNGGEGGSGAPGGYAAVVQYPVASTDQIVLSIGAGGNGGGGGARDPSARGEPGDAGGRGEISSLKIGNITVLQAYGGGNGNGGRGGAANKGSNGNTNGNTTNSLATGGKNTTTDANTPTFPFWPTNNSTGGFRGIGGNQPTSAGSGDPGSSGFAEVWFLYQA